MDVEWFLIQTHARKVLGIMPIKQPSTWEVKHASSSGSACRRRPAVCALSEYGGGVARCASAQCLHDEAAQQQSVQDAFLAFPAYVVAARVLEAGCSCAGGGPTPSITQCSAYKFWWKSNFVNFDQVYRENSLHYNTKYVHSENVTHDVSNDVYLVF